MKRKRPYWGYTRVNHARTGEYEVTHPRWRVYPVKEYPVKVDFSSTYGPAFAHLNQAKPASVMLAEGSKITVEKRSLIEIADGYT